MSKVLVDREMLERIANDDEGAASLGDFEELKQVLAQPAEAEGVVGTGTDAWMALHLLDRLSVDSSDELRVMQVEGIVKSMGAALSAVTAERDRLEQALGDKALCAAYAERQKLRAEVEVLRDLLREAIEAAGAEVLGIHLLDRIDAAMAAKEE